MSHQRIRQAFDRLKSEASRRVSPADGLARIHGVRWWHRALAPALGFGVVIVAVLAVVLVFDGPEEELPTTLVPATTVPGTTIPGTTVPATTAPTTTPPTTPATTVPAFCTARFHYSF